MTYNASYSTGDFSAMVVDLMGTALFEVLQFVALIVLLALVVYLWSRVRKLGLKL